MKPCTHGFPKPSNCFQCMEDGNIEPPPGLVKPKVVSKVPFTATFDGDCPLCGEEILMGDMIVKLDNEKWAHDSPCSIDLERVE